MSDGHPLFNKIIRQIKKKNFKYCLADTRRRTRSNDKL